MNRQVSLFSRRTEAPVSDTNKQLFANPAKTPEPSYSRSADGVVVAEALKAAHARMNRLFTTH